MEEPEERKAHSTLSLQRPFALAIKLQENNPIEVCLFTQLHSWQLRRQP